MKITVNGKLLCITESLSVDQLLCQFNISGPIAVEINQNIVPHNTFPTYTINSGDTIEIVKIIGGG